MAKTIAVDYEKKNFEWDDWDDGKQDQVRIHPLVPVEWKFQYHYAMQELLKAQGKIMELEAEAKNKTSDESTER